MEYKTANEVLFHPSAMGKIMTGVAKGWTVEKSLTCMQELVDIYRQSKWRRRKDVGNKYTKKGTAVEENGLTTYSLFKGKVFNKNTHRISNDYFNGEIDTFDGPEIMRAIKNVDVKCSWDWTTFPSFVDKVDSNYDYQANSYMDLNGAPEAVIAYCLENTPAAIIEAEINKLAYTLGADRNDSVFIRQAKEIEKNSIVDITSFSAEFPRYQMYNESWDFDIPLKERVHEVVIKRNEETIAAMKKRIDDCRLWMNNNLFIS